MILSQENCLFDSHRSAVLLRHLPTRDGEGIMKAFRLSNLPGIFLPGIFITGLLL